jgi:hypothetical protein
LAAAQQMPGGPERVAALNKARQLKADERRWPIRERRSATKPN